MKTFYVCEKCLRPYDTEAQAKACEALKPPDRSLWPPLGLLFGTTCGPGPRCLRARPGAPEQAPGEVQCDHLCQRGFVYVVQGVFSMEHDPHRLEIRLGMFRYKQGDSVLLDGLASGAHRKGYQNWSAGTCFHFGESQYGEWVGFADWRDWPSAEVGPTLYRAIHKCRQVGFEPHVLQGRRAVAASIAVPSAVDWSAAQLKAEARGTP